MDAHIAAGIIFDAAIAAFFVELPGASHFTAFTAIAAVAPDVAAGTTPHTDADIAAAVAVATQPPGLSFACSRRRTRSRLAH